MPLFKFDNSDLEKLREHSQQRQRVAMAREQATEELASRVSAIQKAYPHLSSGLAYPLARKGFGPNDEAVKLAAEKSHKSGGFGWHSVTSKLKGLVRGAAAVGGAPIEELQGVLRNISTHPAGAATAGAAGGAAVGSIVPGVGTAIGAGVGAGVGALAGLFAADQVEGDAKWELQSSAGVAAGKVLSGKRVDLGTGFLPGGQVHAEQVQRSRNVTVGGHSLTPGRLIAASVVEPGTGPYNALSGLVDFSVSLKGDPTAMAGAKIAKVRKAGKLFVDMEKAGGIGGAARKTVNASKVDEWLKGDGRRVIDWLADNDNVHELWRALGKKSKGDAGLPASMLPRLVDATTPEEVEGLLRPLLGTVIREKPEVPGALKAEFGRRIDRVRLFHSMPGRYFDLLDLEQSTNELEKVLRNAKMDDATVGSFLDRMLRAGADASGNYTVGARNARFEVLTDAMSSISSKVAADSGSKRLGEKVGRMFREQMDETRHYFVNELGEDVPVLGAVIDGEMKEAASPHLFNEFIHQLVPVPDAREMRRATSTVGRFLDEHKAIDAPLVWAEWTMQKVWKPFALLRGAWTVKVVGEEQVRMAGSGLESAVHHPLSFIAIASGRKMRGDIFGKTFDYADETSEIGKAVTRGAGPWLGKVQSAGRDVFEKGDELYEGAWRSELDMLQSDRIAPHVAGRPLVKDGAAPTPDELKEWFWSGDGAKLREAQASAPGAELFTVRTRPTPGSYAEDGKILSADDYVDSLFDRVKIKTGGDADLRRWVAEGGDLDLASKFDVGPQMVQGELPPHMRNGGKAAQYADQATQYLFSALMGRPSNYLSRSPAFKQFYWQRLEELLPFVDEKGAAKILNGAVTNGLDPARLARMRKLAASGTGELKAKAADELAKAFGIQKTHDLLFDIADKNNFDEVMRLVLPFSAAWREILTTWAKLGVEEPRVLRRFQQGIEGARESGFFFPDPQTGEEVFAYPLSDKLNKALFGVPFKTTGSVSGLNLFSSNPLVPGFGPVVAIPMGKLIPHKPDWDWARDWFLPFGDPEASLSGLGPAWLRKVKTGLSDPESDRLLGSSVVDVMEYLASTGKYDLSTMEGKKRLEDDAVRKGKLMFLLRGLVQWAGPSAPKFQPVTEVKDGQAEFSSKLAEEFYKLQAEDYQTAVSKFLDLYGDDALMVFVNKSHGGFSPTDELHDFVRTHPGVVDDYGKTYGFFVHTTDGFSFNEYNRQLATGEKKSLKPSEATDFANAKVAAVKWDKAREKAGTNPSPEARQWLSEVREALIADYPGWNPEVFKAGEVKVAIREVGRAATDPRLVNAPNAEPIRKYMLAREKALAAAKASGLGSFDSAKKAQPIREWLREFADVLVEENPEFAVVWDRLFSRELKDDDPVAEQEAA